MDTGASIGCLEDSSPAVCATIEAAMQYCSDNGLYSMRVHQDTLSDAMIEALMDKDTSNRNRQYIIISVCVVVILASIVAVTILIIMVIRDKNTVLGIFAEITKEEVDKTVEYARSFPIRSVRFKLEHARKAEGKEEKYWKIVMEKYKVRKVRTEGKLEESKSFRNLEITDKSKLEPSSGAQLEEEKRKKRKLFSKIE